MSNGSLLIFYPFYCIGGFIIHSNLPIHSFVIAIVAFVSRVVFIFTSVLTVAIILPFLTSVHISPHFGIS